MAKRNETHDNLGFLGDAYQEQLAKYLIEDKAFFCNRVDLETCIRHMACWSQTRLHVGCEDLYVLTKI